MNGARPAESSTCKPLILVLGSAAVGLLFADPILDTGFLPSRVMVVGDWVDLPQQETLVVNVIVTLAILILFLPALHALCVRLYTWFFRWS